MFEFKVVGKAKNLISITDPEQWSWYQNRQDRFKTHKDTETIRLRYPEERGFPTFNKSCDASLLQDWPALEIYKDFIDEYLEILGRHYKFDHWMAILTKLKAGGSIRPHRDGGQWLMRCRRIHMPVVTNEKVFFTCGKQTINMPAGVFHQIDNRNIHAVRNASEEDRVHLIIDLM